MTLRNLFNLIILTITVFISFSLQIRAHESELAPGQENQIEIKPSDSSYRLAIIEPASNFVLASLEGKEVSLKSLQGKIKIINFIYTYCPDACPLVTGRLSDLQGVLKKQGLLGEKVEMISISLDPERDTLEQLKQYAQGFQADTNGWFFLRGTEEQTKKVLSDYDLWTKKLKDGTIDHVMRIYLIDRNDQIREIYNLAFLQPALVVRDIEMLLREK